MKITMTTGGRVTIPKAIRNAMGIRPGSKIAAEPDVGRAWLIPLSKNVKRTNPSTRYTAELMKLLKTTDS